MNAEEYKQGYHSNIDKQRRIQTIIPLKKKGTQTRERRKNRITAAFLVWFQVVGLSLSPKRDAYYNSSIVHNTILPS